MCPFSQIAPVCSEVGMPLSEQLAWGAVALFVTPILLRVLVSGSSGRVRPLWLGRSPSVRWVRPLEWSLVGVTLVVAAVALIEHWPPSECELDGLGIYGSPLGCVTETPVPVLPPAGFVLGIGLMLACGVELWASFLLD